MRPASGGHTRAMVGYAFMYLTVSALALQLEHPNPHAWMAVAAVARTSV